SYQDKEQDREVRQSHLWRLGTPFSALVRAYARVVEILTCPSISLRSLRAVPRASRSRANELRSACGLIGPCTPHRRACVVMISQPPLAVRAPASPLEKHPPLGSGGDRQGSRICEVAAPRHSRLLRQQQRAYSAGSAAGLQVRACHVVHVQAHDLAHSHTRL